MGTLGDKIDGPIEGEHRWVRSHRGGPSQINLAWESEL
jgi:hypothetical protein